MFALPCQDYLGRTLTFILLFLMLHPIKTTVRGILFITEENETNIVLIHRIKQGKEYYAFPGGKIEQGETHQETLIREMKEEINADIEVGDFFAEHRNPKLNDHDYFYLCTHLQGEIKPGDGPEFKKKLIDNVYEIVKIPLKELHHYLLFPTTIKEMVIERYGK
ncbi:MAG: NUDIX domain-containing protein [Candidatus Peribacteria bacterium]|nr:NUDIX domain-containing protein [Candidatus Peribacteria bacterium]